MPRTTVPLAALDVATPSASAPDGTLRATCGLVAVPTPSGGHAWQVAEGAAGIGAGGALSIAVHERSRRGPRSTQADSSLSRLVVLRASEIALIDEAHTDDDGPRETVVWTFDTPDETRRMTAAPLGVALALAVTRGAGIGEPEVTLLLQDDHARPLGVPVPDALYVTQADFGTGLLGGYYAIRYAFVTGDTPGPATTPKLIHVDFPAPTIPDPDTEIDPSDPGGSGGAYSRQRLNLTVSTTPLSVEELSRQGVTGIAVLLTPRAATADAVASLPYHRVLTIALDAVAMAGAVVENSGLITTHPVYDDEHLGHLTPAAGAVATYNGRVILGDTTLSHPPPAVDSIPWGLVTANVRLGVVLALASGEASCVGPPVAGAASITGAASYPDARATALLVYTEQPAASGTWREAARVPLKPSPVTNVAWSSDLPRDLVDGGAVLSASVPAAARDAEPTRVLVSDVGRPGILLARRAARVGSSPTDGVVAFAANAVEMSAGQFGQYPLWALCRQSVSTMQLGSGDVAFESVAIVTREGIVGRRAVAVLGRDVVACMPSGVAILTPGSPPQPITAPLVRETGAEDLLEALGPDTALGTFEDRRRSRREVWLSCGALTFVYSAASGVWGILDRERRDYQGAADGRLVGIDAAGQIFDEAADDAAQPWLVLTARLHLGAPGVRKRLRRLWLDVGRFTGTLRWRLFDRSASGVVLLSEGVFDGAGRAEWRLPVHAREPQILVSGEMEPGESVGGIGIEYDARETHRAPGLLPDDDQDVFWTPSTPFGGRLYETDADEDAIEITTEGVLGLRTLSETVHFFGVAYHIESVEIAPSMLGRERITDTAPSSARLFVDTP